jgi:PTH1 family peptidyl-tRNA hydrolase
MVFPMKLIVGLGNPGKKYVSTRHNAGFQWVSKLAEKLQVTLKEEIKFHGLYARIEQEGNELWLLSPQTYMNDSGKSVAKLCHFYKIHPEQVLVVHDELDLPTGVSRLKLGGGLGGHNGLKDIAKQLVTKDFWRLRIGIGHPGDKDSVVDYVLQKPCKVEAEKINMAINRSLEIWPLIARGDCQAAMLDLHTMKL